jgi:Protein of unknown function (DUF4230)
MPQAEPGANQPATSNRGCLPGMAMGLVLGAAIALGMFFAGRALLARILDRRDVTISASTVVHSVQKLQRLETVVYTLDQIATGERDNPILPASLVGDRILLVVHGDVTAGIDLGQIHDSDITVHGRAVRLHLPQAEIFATRVDNQKTRVFSRDTGLFSSPDPRLESDVRQRAEAQLRATAVQDGILNAARNNAESTLVALMRSLGFEQVDIE